MARVLIIDDMSGVRRSIAAILKRQGHEVDEAGCAGEGLAQLARTPADLVVVDMLMPDMDGLETIERLRALPGGGAIKVLAISGGGSLVDASEALVVAERVADGVLRKPFGQEELAAAVSTALGRV